MSLLDLKNRLLGDDLLSPAGRWEGIEQPPLSTGQPGRVVAEGSKLMRGADGKVYQVTLTVRDGSRGYGPSW